TSHKSFNKNHAIHRFYHALIEALIEDENAIDKGVADIHFKTPKGKAPFKGFKTGKSASANEPVEEPIAEVVMDDEGEDVVRDDDQPKDTSERKTAKTSNPEWFTQPPRPPTHNLEWNKRQYLKSSDLERKYTTLITKIKAARNEIEGIEDMHNVYSTKKILGVKSVSVKKLHGYGHLEEIVAKRVDRQLYKFKEGDFVNLHLNDIEDMLILVVQHKLFQLTDRDIVDYIVALYMFTRSLVIKKWVEDLQLDGMLKKVQDELHHKVLDFNLGYNKEMSKRKWTGTDKKRSELIVELIDKQMRKRRIIQNRERLVGARELEMDYKLMTCFV
ncbi:hypothetical protein Tco_1207395, partial [Tanacetum coccineum]